MRSAFFLGRVGENEEKIEISGVLVVVLANLEVALRMCADGANLGGLLADDKVTAVAAFPHSFFCLLEDLLHLNVVKESTVALLVRLLDCGNGGTGKQGG